MHYIKRNFDLGLILSTSISFLFFLFLFISLRLHAQGAELIKIDGSSTVYPIAEAIAEEYQAVNRGKTKFAIGVSGTGGGFKKFCRGETSIQNASRPIDKTELEMCRKNSVTFVEVPIAFDGIVVVVHTSNPINEISVDQLKKIWQPEAKNQGLTWQSVDKALPANKIVLFGAGSDSGTFDFFTEMIVGKAKQSRSDYTSSEDDNVLIKGISSNKNALGYVPFSYYAKNKNHLKALAIIFNDKSVAPTMSNIKSGDYKPLSRPLFMYVNKKVLESKHITDYLDFFVEKSEGVIQEVHYIPLTKKGYSYISKRIKNRIEGTDFLDHTKITTLINKIIF